MKKNLLIICMLMFAFLASHAQEKRMVEFPYLLGTGMKLPFSEDITGGKDGKIYQIIIKTNKSKKEIINLTSNFLQSLNLVNSKDVDTNLNQVNEEMSEYVLRVELSTGLGIHPVGREPLIVKADMRFEFYEEGVKLSIENFDEEFFLVHVRKKDHLVPTDNMEKYNEFIKKANDAANASSKWGKFIAKTDKIMELGHVGGSLQMIEDQIKGALEKANEECLNTLYSYRDNVKEQESLFNKMISEDEARWYTLDSYIAFAKANPEFNKHQKSAEYALNSYLKAQEQHKLYALSDYRWRRDIRYIFDGVFISLAEMLDGNIEGVAEDGVQTWEREGDLVVPTNPKQKAKYLKKKKSFTDYESYDG